MDDVTLQISDIYVPVKRRKTLNLETVEAIAESIMENGQTTPIQVRRDGERLVLIEGLHRLEACRALGEETIVGVIVQARRH
jgi:ParB-like chromosome segregation protein Spo0J